MKYYLYMFVFISIVGCTNEGSTGSNQGSDSQTSIKKNISMKITGDRIINPSRLTNNTKTEEEFDLVIGNHTNQMFNFDTIEVVFYANNNSVSASSYFRSGSRQVIAEYAMSKPVIPPKPSQIVDEWELAPHTGRKIIIQSANADYGLRVYSERHVVITLKHKENIVNDPKKIKLYIEKISLPMR